MESNKQTAYREAIDHLHNIGGAGIHKMTTGGLTRGVAEEMAGPLVDIGNYVRHLEGRLEDTEQTLAEVTAENERLREGAREQREKFDKVLWAARQEREQILVWAGNNAGRELE